MEESVGVEYINKDVTTVQMGIVAHGVNCQGKMGSGVAKAVREKWPNVYYEYCHQPTGKTMLGKCHIVPVTENDQLLVANLFTQIFYGYGGGKYANAEAIKSALDNCGLYAEMFNLPIYMPRIGCGLGGLKWEEVGPIVEEIADKHQIKIYVCDWENK